MAVTDAPTSAQGTTRTGTGWYGSSWYAGTQVAPGVDDGNETVPELIWPASLTEYAKMRTDATVRSVLRAWTLPVLRARWSIDPRGASDAMVKICADSLGLPVLGMPDVPGPVRRRGVRWQRHLQLASLTMLTYGHAPFEPVYEIRGGAAYLATLGERLPTSIQYITTTRDGDLAKVRQRSSKMWQGTEIDADRLLWYVHEREGAAWQGQSLLRHMYRDWLIKQDMLRVQATSGRRWGAPTPTLEALPGTTPTATQQMEAQAAVSAIRVGETGGITTPGYRLRLVGVEGSMPDVMSMIHYCDQQMARGALTSVLDLANTGTGNRALGDVFADLLRDALEAFAEDLAEQSTELCVRLTDFNEGESANAPAVHVDMASSRAAIAAAVGDLIQAGALTNDGVLEGWVRDALNLPERDPASAVSQGDTAPPTVGPVPGSPDPGTGPTPVTAAAGDWPYRRALTTVEAAAGVDPQSHDAAVGAAVAAILAAWPAITAAQVDTITAAVEAAVDSGDPAGVAAVVVDTTDAADVIGTGMLEAAAAGVTLATAEAVKQGADPGTVSADAGKIAAMAGLVAVVLGQGLVNAAAREAARAIGSGPVATTGAVVAAQVRAHIESLSGVYAQDVISGAVTDAVNAGRAEVFTAAGATGFVASEVRDRATCPACLDIDGTEYASLDEASVDYPGGGYVSCAGRERCRGMLIATYGKG